MTTIAKQLILSRLPLPAEIIYIVKDYAYQNIIDKTRKTKDRIISLINNTKWSPLNYQLELQSNKWLFWIDSEGNQSIQGQCTFCERCGNYSDAYYYMGDDDEFYQKQTEFYKKIRCECLDENQ